MSWEPGNSTTARGVLALLEGFRLSRRSRRCAPASSRTSSRRGWTWRADVAALAAPWRRFSMPRTAMGFRLLDHRARRAGQSFASRDRRARPCGGGYTNPYLDMMLGYRCATFSAGAFATVTPGSSIRAPSGYVHSGAAPLTTGISGETDAAAIARARGRPGALDESTRSASEADRKSDCRRRRVT